MFNLDTTRFQQPKVKMLRLHSALALLLLVAALSQAQICPPQIPENREIDATSYESFSFPVQLSSQSISFNVTDNHNRWILVFTGYNLFAGSFVGSTDEYIYANFYGTLVNKDTGVSYSVNAYGATSFLSFSASPDFKWLTLQDIWIPGTASGDISFSFNMSISYADFWTDSPADGIWHAKSEQLYPGTDCTSIHASNGGYNSLQNKNFWIQFSFADGNQASFNIPQGYYGSYSRDLSTAFLTNCEC